MRRLFIFFTVICLLSSACTHNTTQGLNNLNFEPHLVSKPADMEEVYQELGFTYLTIEEAERKIVAKLDSLLLLSDKSSKQ